ncbi:hypothetical protein Tco_0241226 [Tanacetum coccineum]
MASPDTSLNDERRLEDGFGGLTPTDGVGASSAMILRLKTTPPEFGSFFRGHAGFEHGLSMHQTKNEFATVLMKMDLSGLLTPPPTHLANAPPPPSRDAHVSAPTKKESTVTPASKSLELSTNVDLTTFAVSSKHNEEMGIFISLEDVVELEEVGSRRASSGPNDVVVALFVGEKGDGLVPFSTAGEEAAANSLGLRLSFSFLPFFWVSVFLYRYPEFGFAPGTLLAAFPVLLLLASSTDGLALIPTDTS